ncbi:hypothetical protein FQZ97_948890 [compost metagenome]
MTAAVAITARFNRLFLSNTGNLAQPRKCIELTQNGDDRTLVARLTHHSGRQTSNAALYAETFRLQHGCMSVAGLVLFVICFRVVPNRIAQFEIGGAFRVDNIPDVVVVLQLEVHALGSGFNILDGRSRSRTIEKPLILASAFIGFYG